MKKFFCLAFILSLPFSMTAKDYTLKNDRLSIIVAVDNEITYTVQAKGYNILTPSRLSMTLEDGTVLGASPKVLKISRRTVTENIEAPLYRQSHFPTHYELLDLKMAGGYGVEFRLYPDGLAYRFYTSFKQPQIIRSELVEYVFAEDFNTWVTYVSPRQDKYASSFETQYVFEKISDAGNHASLGYPPFYINCGAAGRVLITESDVEYYPGMFLKAGDGLSYTAEHPGYPVSFSKDYSNARYPKERAGYIASVEGTRTFPWRIIIYGEDDVELANNNMVYQTAAPSRVADPSWIKGGHAAWDWWNGITISGVDFRTGINTQTYKYYVDFAAEYGIENVLIDDGWYSYADHNLLKSRPDVDIPEIVAYAKTKGVGIMLWAVGNTFEEQIEKVCDYYSKLGVTGFKVDFFDRQDQELVESIYHMAEVTARYGLVIDFHGMYKPTGLSRTWPNVVNFEGVFGLEQLKWTDRTAADMPLNDVMLPFTRGAVGPMDYTPGAMINATRDNFRAVDQCPMSQGTRAHQVALYVVFDSPMVMLCDTPTHYIREAETTHFITSIPAVFDQTEVIQGEAGEYVVTLRRKGDSWYIGGITTWSPRDVKIDCSFLSDGEWTATVFRDGINADRIGEDYKIEQCSVNKNSSLAIHCAPGGGFVVKFNQPTQAKIKLPSLLCDNMVLQRNTEVNLWGSATPEAIVKVTTSWNGAIYKTHAGKDGKWLVKVKTADAGGPYSIIISDGSERVLTNILLGEVWICAGQSNMEMPVQGFFGQPCYNAVETMREAVKYKNIRLFTVNRNSRQEPQEDCKGEWLCSNPETVGAFSAVGYFFGRCLNQFTEIPVGLINTSWGGTNIEAWMTQESLDKLDIDRKFIAENWTEEHSTPTALYNGMIAPLTRYVAKGFIWYQGEANHQNYYDYKTMFVEMVRQWRAAWGNDKMPFYFAQIAPYRYDGADLRAIPLLVENQYKALEEIPYSGIAGTSDVGMFSIIHEPDKLRVGERLAYLALSRDYGAGGVPADAPTYKSMEVLDGKIVLSFNNMAAPDDQSDPRSFSWLDDNGKVISPKGFEIAAADRIFHPAKARLLWSDNQIEVSSDDVPEPVAVRYGSKNYVETNIKTTLDQPLAPFRTDNWEIPAEELFKQE